MLPLAHVPLPNFAVDELAIRAVVVCRYSPTETCTALAIA
jgi:hypothetical protein